MIIILISAAIGAAFGAWAVWHLAGDNLKLAAENASLKAACDAYAGSTVYQFSRANRLHGRLQAIQRRSETKSPNATVKAIHDIAITELEESR